VLNAPRRGGGDLVYVAFSKISEQGTCTYVCKVEGLPGQVRHAARRPTIVTSLWSCTSAHMHACKRMLESHTNKYTTAFERISSIE